MREPFPGRVRLVAAVGGYAPVVADDSTYTKPKLRKRLKDEIQAGVRGGKKGQWSARKAQLLVQEYEKAGGGYRGDGKSGSQKHLEDWGKQDWKTKGGTGDARSGKDRYLPDVAWQLLSKEEREATDAPKRKAGEQFVANTDAAREARKAAELLTMKAGEAVKAVKRMDSKSALKKAKTAESKHGKGRKSVLAAIEERKADL
jgi:hypothetical protein